MIRYMNDREEDNKTLIKLDVNGKIFTVDRNLLIKVPGTYFYGMLSSGAWAGSQTVMESM
jgi:hypothetical protein